MIVLGLRRVLDELDVGRFVIDERVEWMMGSSCLDQRGLALVVEKRGIVALQSGPGMVRQGQVLDTICSDHSGLLRSNHRKDSCRSFPLMLQCSMDHLLHDGAQKGLWRRDASVSQSQNGECLFFYLSYWMNHSNRTSMERFRKSRLLFLVVWLDHWLDDWSLYLLES